MSFQARFAWHVCVSSTFCSFVSNHFGFELPAQCEKILHKLAISKYYVLSSHTHIIKLYWLTLEGVYSWIWGHIQSWWYCNHFFCSTVFVVIARIIRNKILLGLCFVCCRCVTDFVTFVAQVIVLVMTHFEQLIHFCWHLLFCTINRIPFYS